MLTKNEITALNLSPTKKDFVQIWNELLEVAGKLSERWDPTSTNESDPGIVILKALTGIADKLNYNIDKNTLEAFMPTAAQEDSMRKLCDMLGYNVKYYRSAETTVTIKYYNADPSTDEQNILQGGLSIPKFTVITNGDQDINYFIIDGPTYSVPGTISLTTPSVTFHCMEGQIVKCESTADNNVITASQISDNNRFYLPEYQIAENGVFVYNVAIDSYGNITDGTAWKKVDNLNIQARETRVFKFGYDSYEGRPYLEFPEDCSELINDGLFIYYARTSGAGGNISARTLSQLELPSGEDWSKVSAESFSVENIFAATSGANIETIGQAYNNFKKTVGTFETLITCRDYMNKIYMLVDEDTGKYKVSNALVTDIRTDLNRAITICSCDDAGIFYKDTPLMKTEYRTLKKVGTNETVEVEDEVAQIDHFDLVLYPFKSYNQIKSNVRDIQAAYDRCFEYDPSTKIATTLEQSDVKTIAHNLISPRVNDIISINNYLKLNAIIGTTAKVTTEEGTLLIDRIKIALANAFNMRELDFGDEIPFDSILSVIENADPRISVVSLAEPELYTTFSVYEGQDSDKLPILREYAVASDWLSTEYANNSGRYTYVDSNDKTVKTFNTTEAKKIYNKLAVRNILAGRVPLFKYNNAFKTSFSDGAYRITYDIAEKDLPAILKPNDYGYTPNPFTPTEDNPFTIYTLDGIVYTGHWVPNSKSNENISYKATRMSNDYTTDFITASDNKYTELEAVCHIAADKSASGEPTQSISNVTLADGEFIKFRAPNFFTSKTYPAYVNYHLALNAANNGAANFAKNADAKSLASLFTASTKESESLRDALITNKLIKGIKKSFKLIQTVQGKKSTAHNPTSTLAIKVDKADDPSTETYEQILNKSGFIKLVTKEPEIAFVSSDAVSAPDNRLPESGNFKLPLYLDDAHTIETDFILNSVTFTELKTKVDDQILAQASLPTEDWTLSYTFEYVPFAPDTLKYWESFISNPPSAVASLINTNNDKPKAEYGTYLWRAFAGSYAAGKYIFDGQTKKLLPFQIEHFDLLDTNRLSSVYIATDLGSDAKFDYISNNEEYQLNEGEYLYIEYTPPSTDSTQNPEPVKEVYGKGTILKPSGFEGDGLKSSNTQTGTSSHKNVIFPGNSDAIPVFSLGASEQITIRELAKVEIKAKDFSNSPTIYLYKNFNDCIELEDDSEESQLEVRSYTLKDGEYIFYTDINQTELAYYTAGTVVTLAGNIYIPKCDIIDLSVIFEGGISEIPWKQRTLGKNASISFQEYQYITLGPNDTLQSLFFPADSKANELGPKWEKCDAASYTVAGSDELHTLPKINLTSEATWEACSILELNVSANATQTVRGTVEDKVHTEVNIYTDAKTEDSTIVLRAADSTHPLSFRTNLTCLSSTGSLKLSDINTSTSVESFEFKLLSEQPLSIVKTKRDKLIPATSSDIVDITRWADDTIKTFSNKGHGEIWTRIPLNYLAGESRLASYDAALRLPINVLPDTYGLFSIYLKYEDNIRNLKDAMDNYVVETWLYLLPGASAQEVSLLNVSTTDTEIENIEFGYTRIKLKPGINCVRVNKTCDLFVKTHINYELLEELNSQASSPMGDPEILGYLTTSALYLDDLRLVDCQPIEYIENGQTIKQKTQGLNLDQVGYLDTTDQDSTEAFDMQTRRKLREFYTSDALEVLDERILLENNKLDKTVDTLKEYKGKLKQFVDFINKTKTELTSLTGDKDAIKASKDLFGKYLELQADLSQEEALKNLLLANEDVADLEKQLVDLLKNLESNDTIKQDLLEALDELESLAIDKAGTFNSLTKSAILADYEVNASTEDNQLKGDLTLFSISEINAKCTEKLRALIERVTEQDNVENSKDTLLNHINNLNIHNHSQLLSKAVSQLKSRVAEQGILLDLLKKTEDSAKGIKDTETGTYKVDYVTLRADLINLRAQLNDMDLLAILSDLEYVLDDSSLDDNIKYQELEHVTTELKTLLNTNGEEAVGSYISMIATVDSLIESAQNKLESNIVTYDSLIVNLITILSNGIHNIYDSQLSNLANNLNSIVEDLTNFFDNEFEVDSTNTVVEEITNQLKVYYEEWKTALYNLQSFTELSSYSTSAIISVWPSYMKRSYITSVTNLYKALRKAIDNPRTDITFKGLLVELEKEGSRFYNDAKLRQPYVEAANLTAFQQIFEQTKKLTSIANQNSTRMDLIGTIGLWSNRSPDLIAALNTIVQDESSSQRNAVLTQLINSWKAASTIVEKQQLLQELIAELNSVITLDTKLVEISKKLLCPSILLFLEDNIPENITNIESDEFYCELYKYYITQKETLLSSTSNTFISNVDLILAKISEVYEFTHTLLAAINNTDDISNWVINNKDNLKSDIVLTGSLLSKSYQNILLYIQDILDIKAQVDTIQTSQLLTILQRKDLVVAWQDKNAKDTWLDSLGNIITDLSNVDVKLNNEGEWLDNSGKAIDVGINSITDDDLTNMLKELLDAVEPLGKLDYLSTDVKPTYRRLLLETQLLEDIQALDRNREFYYNVPIESIVAIDFNEGETKLNTLMNPAVNYDINNINNNFVISKIDINYLDSGLHIARSSKLG
jgi:hypothetical protein